MCGSEELIHDARQVDLEEAIKMNETPMYLVPGRLTDEIQQKIARRIQPRSERDFSDAELELIWVMAGSAFAAVQEIGTPIQPCADVETVGYAHGKYLSAGHAYKMINPITRSIKRVDAHFDTALVRRTDMEAQIARVVAEKDAEIARLRDAIHKMTSMSMNSGAWLSNNRIANCRDELSAMTRLGNNALKGGAA